MVNAIAAWPVQIKHNHANASTSIPMDPLHPVRWDAPNRLATFKPLEPAPFGEARFLRPHHCQDCPAQCQKIGEMGWDWEIPKRAESDFGRDDRIRLKYCN
jgi:hypothetical protein